MIIQPKGLKKRNHLHPFEVKESTQKVKTSHARVVQGVQVPPHCGDDFWIGMGDIRVQDLQCKEVLGLDF